MAKAKRLQALPELKELDVLEELVRSRRASVSDRTRDAVLAPRLAQADLTRRAAAVRRFLQLPEASLPPWDQLKAELEHRRA